MPNVLVNHEGRVHGPYSRTEALRFLAEGELSKHDPAWTEGYPDWEPLDRVLDALEAAPAEEAAVFTDLAQRPSIPAGVRGFNWGALFLTPVWALGNRVWVGLLSLLPGLGQLVSLWLGFKGRELAWQQGGWLSVEQFRRQQHAWSVAGVVFFVVAALSATVYVAREEGARAALGGGGEKAERAGAGEQAKPEQGGPAAQGSETVPRPRLEAFLQGKTPEQVVQALGKPDQAESAGDEIVFAYRRITTNPATGKVDELVVILFQKGVVAGVRYKQ